MEIAKLQHLAIAMRGALAELFARASSGERSADLTELAQHVREILQQLDEGLAKIATDPTVDTLRDFARAITNRLAAIERELAGERLQ
jgi:pyruvate/2-oxoglutarate dehydrogenase complex dihydrolipoamide dehydrogenase (E3) component